jgi:L,D-peptidoglycan transpeptidase YkuD (ErfK/YbiS/YcfS/YnhG family)
MDYIEVRQSNDKFKGTIEYKGQTYPCVLGPNGIAAEIREGSGKTPAGSFAIRKVYFRSDRGSQPESPFLTEALKENDGWVDDVLDLKNYNRHVLLPYDYSHENLWREDCLYDIIVVLGYNDNPPVVGKGSVIFLHVWREQNKPTGGCVAVSRESLEKILKNCSVDTQIRIHQP